MTKQQAQHFGDFDSFIFRHIGPSLEDQSVMLKELRFESLVDFIESTVPDSIRTRKPLQLGLPRSEYEVLAELKKLVSSNQVFRSLIGAGYFDCLTPAVIQRNIFENPGWYTQYTPYQPEISQGRLEALLNFQTMVMDLTGFPIANASLLDEGTAAAEAMLLFYHHRNQPENRAFFVSESCHPQTLEVVSTRAKVLGIRIVVGKPETFDFDTPVFGALLQYPCTFGTLTDYRDWIRTAQSRGVKVAVATDLLALCLFPSPGEMGADVAVGSAQRFGVPLGYGGPHAAFFAVREEFKRMIPGRIIGASKDAQGKTALRLALQTREQHIRRDKATSNICTAQVLLAIMASMYAVYHGPKGLRNIAIRVHQHTLLLRLALQNLGFDVLEGLCFDTLHIRISGDLHRRVIEEARQSQINLRDFNQKAIGISLDELTREEEIDQLVQIFSRALGKKPDFSLAALMNELNIHWDSPVYRHSPFLTQSVFNQYHSETEMLRYIGRLQQKDLSLANAMIPLGSCTMKLNATSEMIPVSWPEVNRIHPFAPLDQVKGYQKLLKQLEEMLCEVTGFAGVSLQPNAGSQGEYAGLLAIRQYHEKRGESHRDICLIPRSAHGTNPASAVMAGLTVVVVNCDQEGNVDLQDLDSRIAEHSGRIAALMVTYPSTHGVFEESIRAICEKVHGAGGQVYLDGANMNAMIGVCRPGEIGVDVCHLNLHKTFCIPHGGGGPGVGPIAVAPHLVPFLPGHSVVPLPDRSEVGAVSSAPWGSASILPISWMYISMMGGTGLRLATEVAILNANYIAKRLGNDYPVLYRGKNGLIAHECIFDLRKFQLSANVEVVDVARRLMDFGFHAPTISFPVAGTLMVEPTESESKAEIDRFCEAMIQIRKEIEDIELGRSDRLNNPIKNAPHTMDQLAADNWSFPYSREQAVFPLPWVRERKFWPTVGKIDHVFGDRNLICSCTALE